MLMRTSPTGMLIIRATSMRSLSMSSPFLPITMPGRAVWIVMWALRAGRSIWIRLTDACDSFFFRNSRTCKSVFTSSAKLPVSAYQRDVQSLRDAEADADRIYFLTH